MTELAMKQKEDGTYLGSHEMLFAELGRASSKFICSDYGKQLENITLAISERAVRFLGCVKRSSSRFSFLLLPKFFASKVCDARQILVITLIALGVTIHP